MSKILIELKRNWRIIDKDGKEVFDSGELECDSYVGKMADFLHIHFCNSALQNVQTVTGSTAQINAAASSLAATAAAQIDTQGIVVGTGSTAVAMGDYQLGNRISHAATGLNYNAVSFTTPSTSGSTRTFTITRSFFNASSATASTINECGIYAQNGSNYFCVARDVESPAITIGVGNTGTLTYTIGVTVS